MLYLGKYFLMNYRVLLFIFALALFSLQADAQVQKIMTLAGNGVAGFSGDGLNAAGAMLRGPTDVAVDTNGNVYVLDLNNFRVRKIFPNDVITTVAGNGFAGNDGNGSIGTSAKIAGRAIAFDRRGNLLISDQTNSVIRRVNNLGIISKYAGGGTNGLQWGYSGDGGKADTARFNGPQGIATDRKSNLYVADAGNHVVRKIDTFGHISTVAGTGNPGYFGDGGLAIFAELDSPYAVTVDKIGNLYINDYLNNVIRKVDTYGVITTYVGYMGALPGYAGDGGSATLATVNHARGLACDTSCNLYIADANNNVIRKVNFQTGFITTNVGNGSPGAMGDFGYVNGCNLFNPYGVAVNKYGSIFIADANNEKVRQTYSTTGVQNVPVAVTIEVYPNPTSGQITVSGLSKDDKVTLSDVTGRIVSEVWDVASDGSQTFSIMHYDNGVYMLQVNDNIGNRKTTLKVVKD